MVAAACRMSYALAACGRSVKLAIRSAIRSSGCGIRVVRRRPQRISRGSPFSHQELRRRCTSISRRKAPGGFESACRLSPRSALVAQSQCGQSELVLGGLLTNPATAPEQATRPATKPRYAPTPRPTVRYADGVPLYGRPKKAAATRTRFATVSTRSIGACGQVVEACLATPEP